MIRELENIFFKVFSYKSSKHKKVQQKNTYQYYLAPQKIVHLVAQSPAKRWTEYTVNFYSHIWFEHIFVV